MIGAAGRLLLLIVEIPSCCCLVRPVLLLINSFDDISDQQADGETHVIHHQSFNKVSEMIDIQLELRELERVENMSTNKFGERQNWEVTLQRGFRRSVQSASPRLGRRDQAVGDS